MFAGWNRVASVLCRIPGAAAIRVNGCNLCPGRAVEIESYIGSGSRIFSADLNGYCAGSSEIHIIEISIAVSGVGDDRAAVAGSCGNPTLAVKAFRFYLVIGVKRCARSACGTRSCGRNS